MSLKTLLLGVKQKQPNAELSLYVDCINYGTIKTEKTFRDIYMNMRNPQVFFVSFTDFGVWNFHHFSLYYLRFTIRLYPGGKYLDLTSDRIRFE